MQDLDTRRFGSPTGNAVEIGRQIRKYFCLTKHPLGLIFDGKSTVCLRARSRNSLAADERRMDVDVFFCQEEEKFFFILLGMTCERLFYHGLDA